MTLFNQGKKLVRKFNLSIDSEIVYSDFCSERIFDRNKSLKFTNKAILIIQPNWVHSDWDEAKHVKFLSWDNVIEIVNNNSSTKQNIEISEIKKWLDITTKASIKYPYLRVISNKIIYIDKGRPKSVRSKGWRDRIKKDVKYEFEELKKKFELSAEDRFELKIEIFTTKPKKLPDLDRASTPIMDAFEGKVYNSDKQVKTLKPRVFYSEEYYKRVYPKSHPMSYPTIDNIPAGSLFPLAKGIKDYYVIRINKRA